jgi:long-chain acyl-CoA synthetase
MNFYDRLVKETENARAVLYNVPQLKDALSGNISKDTYIAYLTEAYHHVSHTVRFLMLTGATLSNDKKWLHKTLLE